jgi:single-stranded-DNA-specific exonuclease
MSDVLLSVRGNKKKLIIKKQCFENKPIRIRDIELREITKNILENRNITNYEDIKSFLSPSLSNLYNPFLLKDMDIAVDRIIKAILKKEKIFVVGDYDTDGVTSTSLLLKFFQEIGVDAYFYIPKRADGYGLSLDAIKKAIEYKSRLVITVDNGITSLEEIEFARTVGIDVIVTDHHEPQDELPNAYAIVNPKRKDSMFPFRELSGVGVAFNLAMALRNKLRGMDYFKSNSQPNLKKYLDLVALGTLADIVPLLDENRICVKFGLSNLDSSCVGLESLKKVSGVNGSLTSRNVGFSIAPRINAAGRLYDASIVVDMFMKDDWKEAEEIANRLDEINKERRKLQTQIVSEIDKNVENISDSVIVASKKGWHRGVIGIAASSISYKYSKPTIIISEMDGVSVGSGRSASSIDLFDAVNETSDILERFGGHKMAVGITIKNEFIDAFRERINRVVEDKYGQQKSVGAYDIDCETSLSAFDRGFLEELSSLEPYGQSNEEPLFFVKHALIKEKTMILDKYPKYLVNDGEASIWMIAFEHGIELDVGYVYDIVFTAGINNGYMSFIIKDAFSSKLRG